MNTSETTIAIGRLRRGLVLSSAIGATASNPVNAKMAKTTPRNRPAVLNFGSTWKGTVLMPPGPGLMMPLSAKASRMVISRPPRMSIVRPEICTPRYTKNVTKMIPTATTTGHGRLMWSRCSSWC